MRGITGAGSVIRDVRDMPSTLPGEIEVYSFHQLWWLGSPNEIHEAGLYIHSIIMYIHGDDMNAMLIEEPIVVSKEPLYV